MDKQWYRDKLSETPSTIATLREWLKTVIKQVITKQLELEKRIEKFERD